MALTPATHSVDSITVGQRASFATTLQLAKQGDGRAFAELFTALSPRVHGFVNARGVEDPEATTNEVFLKVFRNLGTFRGSEAAFTGWVFQIARNRVVDEYRARRNHYEMVSFSGRHDTTGEAVVEQWVEERSEADQMMLLLDMITPDQREVVLLRVIGGLSFDEIGRTLGRRPGAVRSTYKRARTALEALVTEQAQVAEPVG